LKEFDTATPISLETRAPGTYNEKLLVEGNSILSTVFVASADPGASVAVSYHDHTTGEDEGEEYFLAEHPILSAGPQNSRLTVTRIHNNPSIRCVVTGGNVRFSVYVTVVAAFASDLDAALQMQEEVVVLDRDKGIPITVLDSATGKWFFLQSTNGRLQIDVPGVLQTTQQLLNFRRYNATLVANPGESLTHVDYEVPAGKRLYWTSGFGSADGFTRWTVEVDGARFLTQRNSYDDRNVKLALEQPIVLNAGQRIKVFAENVSPFGRVAEIETYIFGALEDA
jgi:hypothetical protein